MSARARWEQTKRVLGMSWYPVPAGIEVWVGRALFWWIVGGTIAVLLADDDVTGTSNGHLAWAGVVYGALAAAIYSATVKYRIRRGLTWAQVTARAIAIAVVWGASALLVNNRKSLAPFLFVVGLSVVYVAVGLLVLYLIVRVARVAWRHGGPKA
jgi:asparagine N-glycosylation enzyme membrane subunit Stt3